MSSEIQSLRAEVASLRGEVRRKRRWGRLLPVAVVALLSALLPLALLAANFTDLNPGSPHNANITAIKGAGITKGCNPPDYTQYCPNGLVTREEMASFLARTAGLGGNPPVADAATLQGYPANGLVRTNVGFGAPPVAVTGSPQILTSTTLTLPGPGLVIVTSAVTFRTPLSATQLSEVGATVSDRATAVQGTAQFAFIGNGMGTTVETSLAPTWVFQATTGGVRVFDLLVQRDPSSLGTAAAGQGTITATYVPFGPNGALAAEQPSDNTIVWHHLIPATSPQP